jgi:PIN domain nuclease of toxin-antitoxin system
VNRILIDTHVLLWWLAKPERLKNRHIEILEDSGNIIEVSICSLFEITTKKSVGKLNFEEDFEKVLEDNDFYLLSIQLKHLRQYEELPKHHEDPFDRMLIAQAVSEQISVISYDANFKHYEINLL